MPARPAPWGWPWRGLLAWLVLLSSPSQALELTDITTLYNPNCVQWAIVGPCYCNLYTPCLLVTYWEPGWLVETVKQPGTTTLAPGRRGSTRHPGAVRRTASRNARAGSSIQLPKRCATGKWSVPQWIGTAWRTRAIAQAVAASSGPRCPSGSRGPHPPIGTSARSMDAAPASSGSEAIPGCRPVSPANQIVAWFVVTRCP